MRSISLWNQNPWSSLNEIQREIDRVFDRSQSSSNTASRTTSEFVPAVDVEENESHYLLSLDVPGMNRDDFKIEMHENQLTISGERKLEQRSEKGESLVIERTYGQFRRLFTLPHTVDTDKIEATYQDGVLTLALAKAEMAKPRQIKVQDGKGSFFKKFNLASSHKDQTGDKTDRKTA